VFLCEASALCALYFSSSMLKQMHIYLKLCVFTVSSDDTFSLQDCNVNKYVHTDLLIYSGTPNTTISVPLVYYMYVCVCVCIYIYIYIYIYI
jgi:hypothetical protein